MHERRLDDRLDVGVAQDGERLPGCSVDECEARGSEVQLGRRLLGAGVEDTTAARVRAATRGGSV
jgi:hypothetical protein